MKWALVALATCGTTPASNQTGAETEIATHWQDRAISGGWGFHCIAKYRRIVCFPYREPGPDGEDKPYRAFEMPFPVSDLFATGNAGACATSREGRVACWGALFCDPYIDTSCQREPLRERSGGYRRFVWTNQEACVLDTAGSVRCAPREGLDAEATPRRWLERVRGVRFVELVASDGVCALSYDGQVWCWGEHWGRDFLDPFRIQLRGPATALVGNINTTCAIVNGSVICWGRYPDREIPPEPSDSPIIRVEAHEIVPIRLHRVRGLPRVVRLMDCLGEMFAFTEDGAAWFWGGGYMGVRDGVYDPAILALDRHGDPQPKRIVARGVVDSFTVGLRRACFVMENGSLHCDELYRGMGLEEIVDRVCYFDGPESRAALERGERLDPPPSSTCD